MTTFATSRNLRAYIVFTSDAVDPIASGFQSIDSSGGVPDIVGVNGEHAQRATSPDAPIAIYYIERGVGTSRGALALVGELVRVLNREHPAGPEHLAQLRELRELLRHTVANAEESLEASSDNMRALEHRFSRVRAEARRWKRAKHAADEDLARAEAKAEADLAAVQANALRVITTISDSLPPSVPTRAESEAALNRALDRIRDLEQQLLASGVNLNEVEVRGEARLPNLDQTLVSGLPTVPSGIGNVTVQRRHGNGPWETLHNGETRDTESLRHLLEHPALNQVLATSGYPDIHAAFDRITYLANRSEQHERCEELVTDLRSDLGITERKVTHLEDQLEHAYRLVGSHEIAVGAAIQNERANGESLRHSTEALNRKLVELAHRGLDLADLLPSFAPGVPHPRVAEYRSRYTEAMGEPWHEVDDSEIVPADVVDDNTDDPHPF